MSPFYRHTIPLPSLPEATNLFSISVILPFSYKWSHTVCSLLELPVLNSLVVRRFTLDVLGIMTIREMYFIYPFFLLFPLFFLSSWCTTYFLFRDISLAMFRGELLVPNSHSFPVSENVFISPLIAENILLDIKFQFTVIFLQSLEKCYDTSFGSIISDGKSTSFKLSPPLK